MPENVNYFPGLFIIILIIETMNPFHRIKYLTRLEYKLSKVRPDFSAYLTPFVALMLPLLASLFYTKLWVWAWPAIEKNWLVGWTGRQIGILAYCSVIIPSLCLVAVIFITPATELKRGWPSRKEAQIDRIGRILSYMLILVLGVVIQEFNRRVFIAMGPVFSGDLAQVLSTLSFLCVGVVIGLYLFLSTPLSINQGSNPG